MAMYEVAVPITGWQVYSIEADNGEAAKLEAFNNPPDTDEFDEIEMDLDINNWEVEEL